MKKTTFCALALFCFAFQGHAYTESDRELLGLKGPVRSVTSEKETVKFSENGKMTYFRFDYGCINFCSSSINSGSNYIYGHVDFGNDYIDDFRIDISNHHWASMMLGESEDYSIEYEYNSLGQLTEILIGELHEGAMDCTIRYSNYQTDNFGNWTSRTANVTQTEYDYWSSTPKSKTQNQSYTEYRKIEYTPGFTEWNTAWPRVKNSGNLNEIGRYATSDLTLDSYKDEAANYWTEHVVEYAKSQNLSSSKILELAYNPLTKSNARENLLNIARELIYNNEVMQETDYDRAAEFANKKYAGFDVFDNEYKTKIKARANYLRSDYLQQLVTSAKESYAQKQYERTLTLCEKIEKIDPYNPEVGTLKEETYFQRLKQKKAFGQANEQDFLNYQKQFVSSSHNAEVGDMLVEYALGKKKTYSDKLFYDYLGDFRAVPMSKDSSSKLEHARKKAYTRMNRGRWIGFNIGANVGGSKAEMHGGIEGGFRFGYMYRFFNLWAGAKYQVNSGYLLASDTEGGYLSCNQLSVPVMVRMNLAKDYNSDFYLGLGAEYVLPLKGRYALATGEGEEEYDKLPRSKEYVGKAFWAPRVSLGYSLGFLEMELYGTYNLADKYNVERLSEDDDLLLLPIPELVGEKQFKQTKGKVNIGVSIRFGF